ncbi:mechanosensitive ion channel domain-containing protein [Gallaecimonas sp. GXIMD4217]|uniref:mechanosensitive ion channel family protein n=1 Tax=Gallaecimonas sp. GXIMD4217 TaxID=3131927 RepID=UPI00311AF946
MANWQESFKKLWEMPLYTSGETQIHLNQLAIAGLIVLVGMFLARRLTRLMGRRLGGHMTQSGAYAVERLASYFLYALVLLVALPFAGIPITIFAVLGGALAIGVGFGAQNLINNLISGLILLIERPIRIGDTVELEQATGLVEDIGNRCVRILRADGVHVLVPNSEFLERRVVNWTLVSSQVRGRVSVGVQYGTDVDKVRELMLQAAADNPGVEKAPAPEVLFEEFGDNALQFSLLFWAKAKTPMELRRIQSALRFVLDELLAEAGITIAFPQMDMHLDTARPLRVEISRTQGG